MLSTADHARDSAGMTYIYPVVSRRANGVSIGINLNINNACNWRCIYCQVPDLKRGGPPPVDLDQLEAELRHMLDMIVHGDFMARHVPETMRQLHDIAFSGNGEPTTAMEFPECVARVGKVLDNYGLRNQIKLVLISNGSQMQKTPVQEGLRAMTPLGGEIWFKIDRATQQGMAEINDTQQSPDKLYRNLQLSAHLCPTWVQTCLFSLDGQPPGETELSAYLELLSQAQQDRLGLKGVLLYGLARPSLQAEAPRLSPLSSEWLQSFAKRIRALGLATQVRA